MTPEEAADLMTAVFNSYQTSPGDCMMELGEVVWLTYHPTSINHPLALCDGSVFDKADYPVYWELLDSTGWGPTWEYSETQFKVPDLLERFPRGTNDEPGGQGGEAAVTLSAGEMPAHTHTEGVVGITGLFVAPGEVPAIIAGGAGVTGSAGGGGSHNNIPPFTYLAPYIRIE